MFFIDNKKKHLPFVDGIYVIIWDLFTGITLETVGNKVGARDYYPSYSFWVWGYFM